MLVFFSAPVLLRCVISAGSGGNAIAAVRPHEGFYLRNNMWLADARTFVSLVRYLFQPDGQTTVTTNIVVNG
jgi:hypothetical protein